MTCKDIMTPDPSCCLPSDSVAAAAQIMKRNDIGPVLVVSDRHENRLVGIVTDRDLTLKVIADGRDPHTTRVDEVMSLDPVCCPEDAPTDRALQLMAQHQVRRIPIVNEQGQLSGIVAQADIARFEDEDEVGRVVEQISEPYGSMDWQQNDWDEGRRSRDGGWSSASSLACAALCVGLGAGLMYVLGPTRGRTRRRRFQQRTADFYHSSGEALESSARDLKTRAEGMVATAKSVWQRAEVPDEKLSSRIRSKLGRHVSSPQALEVTSDNGHVILSGPILSDEVRGLLDCVNAMPGVQSVESRLDVHETASSHPSLQQGTRSENFRRLAGPWKPKARVLAGVAGGGMLLYGMRNKRQAGEKVSGF